MKCHFNQLKKVRNQSELKGFFVIHVIVKNSIIVDVTQLHEIRQVTDYEGQGRENAKKNN